MSDTSSLTELARFVGQSGLINEDAGASRRAVNDITRQYSRRPGRQKVSDLLGVVLMLSARTRRMISPRVDIELDVFGPGGERAVRLALPVGNSE
jgi:hypothetical protein